ncbi:MAG TPA: efflux RND transporter permease subunit, partial [Pirellulales bacterium]|nr:efflux RND transporter permease subunit [Pirellulales bacterium]
MIEKIIEASIRNRFLVLILGAALTVAGVYAMLQTPVDAIPDLSENQVIVFTDWMGRSPWEIEDQVTYPLSLKLKGLAGMRAVRSSSEFNFSMITLIFEEDIDFYFARQRVTEKLAEAATFLPPGVLPYMAPDATALGQVFWYTVEDSPLNPIDSGRLWALNKFYIAPQLNAAAGAADVADVGGTPLEYQIDVRPEALRAYGITLGELYAAVAKSNMPAGGGVVQKNNAEYIVRGLGWIKDKGDIENTVVKEVNRVPIYVKTIAKVQLGTQFRRSVYEKDGNDVVGGVVLMRHEENPLAVTERVKQKIQEIQPGLPEGVHIVPAYDRTRLIDGAIHTLSEVMWHEMLIASVAILLILSHFRSVFVICITLPLAVLFSFLTMWLLRTFGIIDIQANIMSLAGITISIGILVDQAIVMVENATHALKDHFGDRKVTGDIRELVIPACRTVGRPIFFSVMIMLISFIPVFMLSGREGKYFHPLAFTKSFALFGVALISITLVPALIPTFIKGRLRSEEENWIVRSFINIYKPLLTWALPRRNLVMWMFAVLLILAAGMFPLQAIIGQGASEIAWRQTFLGVFALVTSLTVLAITGKRGPDLKAFLGDCGLALGALLLMAASAAIIYAGMWLGHFSFLLGPFWLWGTVNLYTVAKWSAITAAAIPLGIMFFIGFRTQRVLLWRTITLSSLIVIGLWAYGFNKIGVAFMPALDEGTTLDMPITVPRASVTQSGDDLKARDALLRGFPEVESVIGKAGRANTPTDPSPLDMVETFVNFRPKELWPKRVLKFNDAWKQVEVVVRSLEKRGYLLDPESLDPGLRPEAESDRQGLINDAAQKTLERFDETLRELALLRYVEFEESLSDELTRYAVGEVVRRIGSAGKLHWPEHAEGEVTEDSFVERLSVELTPKYGVWLAKSPALEDAAQLSRDVAEKLHANRAIDNIVGALDLDASWLGGLVEAVAEALGSEHRTFAGELLSEIERRRMELWRDRVKHVNWELFDEGSREFCWYALEEVMKAAKNAGQLAGAEHAAVAEKFAAAALNEQLGKPFDTDALRPFVALREELEGDFKKRAFFWPRQTGPKGDLVDDEMGRVLQVPGWSNIFTQPIINRIEMLSTGVRTDIGVKVFGPDLDTIDRVCKEVEAALKPINGARDVIAAPFMGKGYLEVDIDREAAARYGISVEDIENEIEVALAGKAITYTVEARDRFPVRVRYARSEREDEESVRRLLVSPGSMATGGDAGGDSSMASTAGSTGGAMNTTGQSVGHTASPGHAARGKPLIPLSAVADVRVAGGPAMIKSENSQLLNYVTLMVRGRDVVGFVDEAQRVVAQKVKLPEGVHIEWSGEFEHQVRAARTLRFV